MRSISEFVVKSEIEMRKLGYLLTNLFQSQDLITFTGDLGVGKTFLCKSIINKLTLSKSFLLTKKLLIVYFEEILLFFLLDFPNLGVLKHLYLRYFY